MSFNADDATQQLSASADAADDLFLSCQGILRTHIEPSCSAWYGPLNDDLCKVQALASEWQAQYASQLQSEMLGCVARCGQAFAADRSQISQLFDQAAADPAGAKAQLLAALRALQVPTQQISAAALDYTSRLRDWGQRLRQAHEQMASTIGRIHAREGALQSQIDAANADVASLSSQVVADRKALAKARSHRGKGIKQTIFGVALAPFTGGTSLILAGIGVSSIVEAEAKVSSMHTTIADYQARIISYQRDLDHNQTQLVALQGLTLSAEVTLSDSEVAEQILDTVRTNWDAFFQEIGDVTAKIANAQDSAAMLLEKAWFTAACDEWDVIVNGAHELLAQEDRASAVADIEVA